MDLAKGHIKALQEGDLTSSRGIEACTNAADALLQCMNVALHPGNVFVRLQANIEFIVVVLLFYVFFLPASDVVSTHTRNCDLLVLLVPTYSILLYRFVFSKFFLFLGHDMLHAVKQQQQRFSDLREQFARRLTNHLNSVFVQQVLFLIVLYEIFNPKLLLKRNAT